MNLLKCDLSDRQKVILGLLASINEESLAGIIKADWSHKDGFTIILKDHRVIRSHSIEDVLNQLKELL